ncbi:hypothetical protein B0H14DRAFT_3456180 [Mycena olivaceomarginata]|nr:hypothetical protein B0H14DRAFT_3456180 [Mycena olivaceomarginata]
MHSDVVEPVHYSLAPKSSFPSEYLQSLPKDAVMTPYRYIASTEHSTTRYTFGFLPPIEEARFPVIFGLTFPDAIPRVITA